MQLINPIWLWGLLGLAIPIAIHLLSRKTGNVIKFGSVKHLDDNTTRRFKSIRLNEYVLLALRSILTTLLVLFLSQLNFSGTQKQNWLLIEHGLHNAKEFSTVIDSLGDAGFELRHLSHGFPALKDSSAVSQKVGYWTIVEELKTQPVKQAVILSNSYAYRFMGKRIGLPDNVRWISKTPDSSTFVLNAVRYSPDSMTMRLGKSGPNKTNYYFKNVNFNHQLSIDGILDTALITLPSTISVAIFNDSSFVLDKNILVAALQAVDKFTPDSIVIKTYSKSDYQSGIKSNLIIMLSEQRLPIEKTKSITFKANVYHEELFCEERDNNNNSAWTLTQRLNPEIALQKNLAVTLASILLPEQKYTARAAALDKRVLPEKLMWAATDAPLEMHAAGVEIKTSQRYLLMIFLALLLLERWLAFKRSQ